MLLPLKVRNFNIQSMANILVSLIIVNRNGIKFIGECLRSIFSGSYADIEVIVVDNDSQDGSAEYIRSNFGAESRLRVLEERGINLGPAACRNIGAGKAQGKYLVFLDNDTEVEPQAIRELVLPLESDLSIGAAQAKLLRLGSGNFYDCAGDFLGPLGFLIERSMGKQDTGQFDFIADILSAKSAASIIRKSLFEKIKGFDSDFFMYLEETDLCWRVWLAGSRVVFIPGSRVYHAFKTPKKDFKKHYSKYVVRFYGCRNYISTLIKNLEFRNLIKILPLHLACWILIALFFMIKLRFNDAFFILKGIGWNIINIGVLLKKRRYINQHIRRWPDREILSRVADKRGLGYYLQKATSYIDGKTV